MQSELQKVLIRGNYSLPSESQEDMITKKAAPATPVKRKQHAAQLQSESAKKQRQVDLEVNEKEIEKKMTPMKKSTFFNTHQEAKVRKGIRGIVFRFQKGFTCAVRQPAKISDFL